MLALASQLETLAKKMKAESESAYADGFDLTLVIPPTIGRVTGLVTVTQSNHGTKTVGGGTSMANNHHHCAHNRSHVP